MDVSGWTVDQKMRLPDWCFGNRTLIGIWADNEDPGNFQWFISEIGLPDPCCIWEFSYIVFMIAGYAGSFRAGLADVVPTSVAEMNDATEFYPYWGAPSTGPNYLLFEQEATTHVVVPFRKGMITGGKKLVVEAYCSTVRARIFVSLLVSGLPTSMAGWLAHNKV